MLSLDRLAPLAVIVGTAFPASAATFLPDFDAASFVRGAPIDNAYLPWRVGAKSAQVARYIADGEHVTERDAQKVLGHGPKILGVRTTTVLDKGYENGVLTEKTFDHYAQDRQGNVWYMGEDTTSFERDDNGHVISRSTEGSWRAGRNDALPGYAMPVNLAPGFAYYQEFAAEDDALDEARTIGILDSLKVGSTTYRNVLQVLETTAAEPDSREFKFYAPGVGLIRAEEGLDAALSNPEVTFNRVAAVPLPPTLVLLVAGIAGLLALGRRGQRTTTRAPFGMRS